MSWTLQLPQVSLTFNILTALLVFAAFVAIRRGNRLWHQRLILASLLTSAVFLASYLTYHYFHGVLRFRAGGWIQKVYWLILGSHVLCAIALLPLISASVYLAFSGYRDRHRRVAPYTLGTWLYVSVTGALLFSVFMP